ncbi:MAG: cell division protein FtsH [Deltaproteobacteria bacterium]|nr:cell division protein FtsH [Deltaproteobacteria bacterium]
MKSYSRGLFLWVFLVLVLMLAFTMVSGTGAGRAENTSFSKLVEGIKDRTVTTVEIQGNEITGEFANKDRFKTVGPTDSDWFLELLNEHEVEHTFVPAPPIGIDTIITTGVPVVLIVVLFVLFMRQLQSSGGRAMSFGKSRARLLNEAGRKVTFDDVAGNDEAKAELEEVIHFLREPRRFTRLGGRIPKGVLLMGSPGTGKTLLARAVAGEAGVAFFSISGSDFVEMFVGVGASRVRDLFEQGKKQAPCIIFVDEIDAVGRHRGAGMGGGHDEREQTLNQLLVEMDGFESNEGVILMAATNRPDVLDPALLRPGRFDRRVVVSNPDVKGREGILAVHTRKTPLSDDVDLLVIAKGTPGFSGADLENLVNEAALLAARQDKDSVSMSDLDRAKDKVSMGVERRSLVVPERERRRTAYHEAGHAIVARLLPHSDTVHKVTIVPRGRALGVTQMLPDEDKLGATSEELTTKLAVFMGGRAAEALTFNEISTGASNDLQQATRIARAMVTQYGMSETIGPMSISEQTDVFMGRDFGRTSSVSESTARMVDTEVKRLLSEADAVARSILNQNTHILEKLAQILLSEETVEGVQFEEIVQGLNPVYPVPQSA